MSKWKCPTCGAAIDAVDEKAQRVTCRYCQSMLPITDFIAPEIAATTRLEENLGRKLDEQTRAQRHAVGIVVGGVVVILCVAIGVVVMLSPTRAAPTVAETAPSTVPSPPTAPSAEPNRPQPLLVFGGAGTGAGRFDRASHLALDRQANVYVADRTNRIQVFDPAGHLLRTLVASTDRVPRNALTGDITTIQGLAVDAAGKVWVSIGYDLVRLDGTTGQVEHKTDGVAGETCFRDLTVDQHDQIFANSSCTDTDRYALLHLTNAGHVVKRIAEPNDYSQASTERLAVDGAGRWYVPFGNRSEVQVLEPDGTLFTRFGGHGADGFGSYSAGPVALDPAGRIFVRDASVARVFTPEGHPLGTFDPGAVGPLRDLGILADGSIWVLTTDGQVAHFEAFPTAQ